MQKFKEVSPVGVECQLCSVLLPKADIKEHICNPHAVFENAKRQYELEDKKKEEVVMEEKHLAIKDSIVMPAVSPEEAVKRWKEYQDLKEKIVEENDIQIIQKNKFLKKSYWRKLATFFNLSVEIVEEKSEVLNRLGKEVIVYHFRARATAPNGRFAEGTGSCDIYDHATIHEGKFCTWDKFKKAWKEAEEKSLHNTRTTAETRAWNRAVSNLVGGGEVSAEEIKEENGKEETSPTTEPLPPIQGTLTIEQAQKRNVGEVFDVIGILSDYTTESITKKDKTKADVTHYKILSEDSEFGMDISKWGKVPENIKLGDGVIFVIVKVAEFKGEKKYLAQGIDLVKPVEE